MPEYCQPNWNGMANCVYMAKEVMMKPRCWGGVGEITSHVGAGETLKYCFHCVSLHISNKQMVPSSRSGSIMLHNTGGRGGGEFGLTGMTNILCLQCFWLFIGWSWGFYLKWCLSIYSSLLQGCCWDWVCGWVLCGGWWALYKISMKSLHRTKSELGC